MTTFIIIGAGILGASTGYQLAKRGASVTIIDRREKGQATDAAAGIICPWISQRRNQAWYQLAKAGARFYPSLVEELERAGETDTGYARVGALALHEEPDKLLKMQKRTLQRKEDAPEIGTITPLQKENISPLFPPLADKYVGLWVEGAARVDGRALCNALLRAAQKAGATFIQGDASLEYRDRHVTGVKVGEDVFDADTVIACAGAWAKPLLQPLGIQFQVTYQKAQIIHLELPHTQTGHWPVVMPPGSQYLLAFEDQRVVVGATHEDIEEFDTRITPGGLQEVLSNALDAAPGLADSTFLEARVGFRPFTPGFLPVIGALPGWDGILVANGLGASGLTMGPFLGDQLAKLALGLELDIDLGLYDVGGAIEITS